MMQAGGRVVPRFEGDSMYELVLENWWVLIFSVTALALAIKFAYERLPRRVALRLGVRKKIASLKRSDAGDWLVTVTLADGRRYSNVRITRDFQFADAEQVPFRLGDIVDVALDSRKLGDPAEPPKRVM